MTSISERIHYKNLIKRISIEGDLDKLKNVFNELVEKDINMKIYCPNPHWFSQAFIDSCWHGNASIAEFLYEWAKKNECAAELLSNMNFRAFHGACIGGNIEIAKQIIRWCSEYNLQIDIHSLNGKKDDIFRWCCRYNQVKGLKFINDVEKEKTGKNLDVLEIFDEWSWKRICKYDSMEVLYLLFAWDSQITGKIRKIMDFNDQKQIKMYQTIMMWKVSQVRIAHRIQNTRYNLNCEL